MKRILLGSAFASIVALTSAFAADMAVKYKAPVAVAAVYGWTGGYVGLNAGYSWGNAETTLLPLSIAASRVKQDVNGGVFGVQAGYNWQMHPNWVIGVEADVQVTGQRGDRSGPLASLSIPSCLGDCTLQATISGNTNSSLPWFATFRGRAGVLVDPTWLLYGTGGLAVGEVKYGQQLALTIQQIRPVVLAAVTATTPAVFDTQSRIGWTLGAGTEKKLSQNWSAKLEYLYVDLGTKSYFNSTQDVRFRDHIVRAGVNYAFSPTAVVAKY